MESNEYIIVKTAIDSQEQAQKIAEVLVKQRLASCVHVIGPFTSTYWWKGKMEIATEWECEAKTRKELYDNIEQAIRANHPYEEPEIIATQILAGSKTYLDWIHNETAPHQ